LFSDTVIFNGMKSLIKLPLCWPELRGAILFKVQSNAACKLYDSAQSDQIVADSFFSSVVLTRSATSAVIK
jgi:hypothetical protein